MEPMAVTLARYETTIVSSLTEVKRIGENPASRRSEVDRTRGTRTTLDMLCMLDTKIFPRPTILDDNPD